MILWQGNGLHIRASAQRDTGVYVCHLDNFVQPVVSYKFTLFVEGIAYFCHNTEGTSDNNVCRLMLLLSFQFIFIKT